MANLFRKINRELAEEVRLIVGDSLPKVIANVIIGAVGACLLTSIALVMAALLLWIFR